MFMDEHKGIFRVSAMSRVLAVSRMAPNLLEQDFTAAAPNQKYVGDITYCAPNLRRRH